MRITRLKLKNWKNFVDVDVDLTERVFILGNNGLGKSNLIDVLRFLYDISKPTGGGLQQALVSRGGLKQVRSLFSRRDSTIEVSIEVGESEEVATHDGTSKDKPKWRYELKLELETRGKRRALVAAERVFNCSEPKPVLDRPTPSDREDDEQLTQTALEQPGLNKCFRELAEFIQRIRYLHLVPQLIRYAPEFQARTLPDDPFGQDLMKRIGEATQWTREARLRRIDRVLKTIIPNYGGELKFVENSGQPHIIFRHKGWCHSDVWQNEEQLSDGALRMIGLFWALQEGQQVLLLEQPELSFNEGILRQLPALFSQTIRAGKKPMKQIIMTTHSEALMSDEGIDGGEVLVLTTDGAHTKVERADEKPDVFHMLQADLSIPDAVFRFVQS